MPHCHNIKGIVVTVIIDAYYVMCVNVGHRNIRNRRRHLCCQHHIHVHVFEIFSLETHTQTSTAWHNLVFMFLFNIKQLVLFCAFLVLNRYTLLRTRSEPLRTHFETFRNHSGPIPKHSEPTPNHSEPTPNPATVVQAHPATSFRIFAKTKN